MKRFACSLLLMALHVLPLLAQSAPRWEWRKLENDPGRLYLFRNGVQVGGLDTNEGYYRPLENGVWGPRGQIDLEVIPGAVGANGAIGKVQKVEHAFPGPNDGGAQYLNGGVQTDRISPVEKYESRDHYLTRSEALHMVSQVPNHHLRRRLTFIGPEESLRAARADVKSGPLADWVREQGVLVQFYNPGDWAVRPEAGFVHDARPGHPTVCFQEKPDERGYGKELFHGTEYVGAGALLAHLRKKDPNYTPRDPREPATPEDGEEEAVIDLTRYKRYAIPAVLGAGLLALALYRRRP